MEGQINERLTSLENRFANLEDKIDRLLSQQNEQLIVLNKTVAKLEVDFSRYKGFFGGMVFAIASLWAALELAMDKFLK